MASKIAPTEYHSIVKIVRKAIVAIFINAIVAVNKVSMADRIAPTDTIMAVHNIVIELMAVMRKAVVSRMRKAGRKETIGTPSAIMQTHANTSIAPG